jgi:ankyrin repeat protein
MIKLFLDNQSPVNATDIDGMTALHHGTFLFSGAVPNIAAEA